MPFIGPVAIANGGPKGSARWMVVQQLTLCLRHSLPPQIHTVSGGQMRIPGLLTVVLP